MHLIEPIGAICYCYRACVWLLPYTRTYMCILSFFRSLISASRIRCLSCPHWFKKPEDLQKHMNHPMTSCRPWLTELIKVSQLLGCDYTHNWESSQSDDQDIIMDEVLDMDLSLPEIEEEQDMNSEESGENTGPFYELFPDAAKIIGKESTFMDNFDADENVNLRDENIFYPFASRQD